MYSREYGLVYGGQNALIACYLPQTEYCNSPAYRINTKDRITCCPSALIDEKQ